MNLVNSKKLVLGVALSLATLAGQFPITTTTVANAQAAVETQKDDSICYRPHKCQIDDASKPETTKYDGYQRLTDIVLNILGED